MYLIVLFKVSLVIEARRAFLARERFAVRFDWLWWGFRVDLS